jgi:indole-3-acetate monooxygenase
MRHVVDESLVARARALGPVIREHAAEAERERQLSSAVIAELDRNGLTKMFLPKSLGGLETDPMTCLHVVEEIARFDSVAGWILMVANSGAWFSARMAAATVEEIYRDGGDCLIATAFQPPVEARPVAGGYQLTGRRPFASGIHAARWLCLTGLVMDGEQPRMVDGRPELISAIMPAASAAIVDTWNGLGLRGSDSNDVAVRELFVPAAFTCPLTPGFEANRHYRAPLYRLPAMAAIVLATIPPIALAIARNAIEEVRGLCAKRMPMGSAVPLRDRGAAQAKLGRAEGMLRSARALVHDAMGEAWAATLAGKVPTLEEKAGLLLAAAHAGQVGAEVTDLMFSLGGSSAVFVGHPLERLFRDAQVIRQHGFVNAGRYETVAQVALGLEPDLPFIHF